MSVKNVFDEFIQLNSSLLKESNSNLSSKIKGWESMGGSVLLMINSDNEIFIRLKKITGKKLFGGLKWEWNVYNFISEKKIYEVEENFILNPEEKKLLFDRLSKLYTTLNTRLKKDYTKYSTQILEPIKKIHHYNNRDIVEIDRGKIKFEFWFLSEKINILDKKNQEELFFEVSNRTSKFKRGWILKKLTSSKYQFKENLTKGMRFILHVSVSKNYISIKIDDIDIGRKQKNLFFVNFIEKFNKNFINYFPKQQLKFLKQKEKDERLNVDKQKTSIKKNLFIKEFDKDGNGTLDVIQTDDFQKILKKHEKFIIGIDRDYIKNFVKLSNYLKSIRTNLQNTFELILKVEFSKDLELLSKILKNKIHTYNSILLHSLSMIVSLTKEEMITFYEIYEMFDELNVYDSKHEKDMMKEIKSINSELKDVNKNLNELRNKLGNISGQLFQLMKQMKESDERIINSIEDLTYTTSSLGENIQSELKSVNSSIQFNNLLTGVQTYQMYKINLNTKSLKE